MTNRKWATDQTMSKSTDSPWQDEQLLRELYHEEGLNQYEIAERLGCARNTITKWMSKLDIQTSTPGPDTAAEDILRSEEKLREVYAGRTTLEVCNFLECGAGTLSYWMNEHGIETGVRCHDEIGEGEGYGEGWNESKREAVRQRDDYECQYCGLSQTEHRDKFYGESLHVHHIQKHRSFDSPSDANDMENLITLCRECHTLWERMAPLRPL